MAKKKSKATEGHAPAKTSVRIDALVARGDLQAREKIDNATVAEYAQLIRDRGEWPFPPLKTVRVADGETVTHYVWDGFHRLEAAEATGLELVPVEFVSGSIEDAKWLALGANTDHGLRRTNADKRRAVSLALVQRTELADILIAQHCGVTDKTVADVRAELEAISEIPTLDYRIKANGERYSLPKKPAKPSPVPAMKPAAPPSPDPFTVDDSEPTADEARIVAAVTGRPAAPPAGSDQGDDDEPDWVPDDGPPDEGEEPHLADAPPARKGPPAASEPEQAMPDEVGLPVPDELREAWATRSQMLSLVMDLRKTHIALRRLAVASGGERLRDPSAMTQVDGILRLKHIDEAEAAIEFAMPYATVCPYCAAKGKQRRCEACRGLGWVDRLTWKDAPEDFKAAARKERGK